MKSKDLIKKLNWRYATKTFDPAKKIPEKDFETLLEVLRLTPSSFGIQPWKFIVVRNPQIRAKLRPFCWDQSQITDASHLIILCRISETKIEEHIEKYILDKVKTGDLDPAKIQAYRERMIQTVRSKDENELKSWLRNQSYIALGNILTSCAVLDIDSCPIEGFDKEKVDELLELQKVGLSSVVMCAVGYRSLDDKYATAKKHRFPLSEVVMEA
jgi:nitroreductase